MYLPEHGMTEAGLALVEMVKEIDLGQSYADMLRFRVAGNAHTACYDRYFVAHENGIAYSRHWNGWGRHNNAIGNFGNFFTVEEMRGQGIGRKLLGMWYEDLTTHPHPPLAIFCTAGHRSSKLYMPYGFRMIKDGAESGPMYLPLNDSPERFRELCDMYYEPSDTLICRSATVEWRHEIDCLLNFAFFDRGLDFGIGDVSSLEAALLYHPNEAKLIFTEKDRCVGWMIGDEIQLYPAYNRTSIQTVE